MMMFSIAVSICLLPLVTAKVWDVQVGGANLLFNPEAIVRPLFPITSRPRR
jgi:hypothetical protein